MKKKSPIARRFGKFALTAFALSLFASPSFSAPKSPEAALKEAGIFLSKPLPGRKAAPGKALQLTLAQTASAGELNCYYIFNHDNGFVIASADDRLPSILGYSDNGPFDENNIPDNMKWWLSQYTAEISAFLPAAPDVIPQSRAAGFAARVPITPLTTTQWDQSAPYNNDCPLDRSGNRSVTGCVATAVAQLMKFHNWPERGNGSNGGVIFSGTVYDWKNMLDTYVKGSYNTTQGAAVAKLMYQVGVAVNMQYSSYASGAYDFDVQLALPKYFKYSDGLRMEWKDYTSQVDWNNMVYAELAAGRPLYYSGSSAEGGHAFVCDGYSTNEFFHFNWGWGGYEDGYFLLSALNPASGGAGSYEGGYNSNQCIIRNIMPNTANPNATKQCALLSTGGFIWDAARNAFMIADGSLGANLIYNPLGYNQTFDFALRVLGVNDTVFDDFMICASNYTLQSMYGFDEITADFTMLADGDYHVSPIFKGAGQKEWEDVKIPLGKQSYVDITVKNGVVTYSNPGPDITKAPHLIVGNPQFPASVYADTHIALKIPILNVGQGDFNDELGFSLFDANDEFGNMASYNARVSVPSNTFNNLEVVIESPIAPGTYKASLIDADNNIYFDNFTVAVKDGKFTTPTGNKVSASNLSPSFYTSETKSPVYFTVKNEIGNTNKATFGFELLDGKTLKPIKKISATVSTFIEGPDAQRLTVAPFDLGIEPGEYLWRVVDENGTPLSIPYPLIVVSSTQESSGLGYVITDEANKKALLTPPVQGYYSAKEVEVKTQLDGYSITGLRNDAFTFATSESVTLPAGITSLPAGSFYNASDMTSLRVEGNAIPKLGNNVFNTTNSKNCWLDVDNDMANKYFYSHTQWTSFRQPFWKATLNNVEIESGVDINPETESPYNPFYMNYDTPATIKFSAPAGMNIKVLVIHNREWIIYQTISQETPLELPALGIHGYGEIRAEATNEELSVDTIEADDIKAAAFPSDVFTIDGKLILKNATEKQLRSLSRGLYLLSNGNKILL